MVLDRLAAMGDTLFVPYLQRQVSQARRLKVDLLRAREKAAIEAGENTAAWVALTAATSHLPGPSMTLLLPSGPRRLGKLSQRRRRQHEVHLRRIIGEAAAPADPAPVDNVWPTPTGRPLAGHLCTMCRGGCCTGGGDAAYLGAATLRRFMATQSALSPEALLAAYLDRLPARSEVGSCVYHGTRGCSLPREMRSDICNNYACKALEAVLVDQHGAQPVRAVIVVQRRQDHWLQRQVALDNRIIAQALITDAGVIALPAVSPLADRCESRLDRPPVRSSTEFSG